MWDEFFVTKRKTNLTNLCSLSTHEEGYRLQRHCIFVRNFDLDTVMKLTFG